MNPADDEEVLEFGRERRRRPAALAAVLALVALVAAGIWLDTRGSSGSQPSDLPTLSTRSTPAPVSSAPTGQLPEDMRNPWDCPAGQACVTSRVIPPHLLSALQHYVPRVRAQWGYTVTRAGQNASGRALWYGRLNARTERFVVVVIVSAIEGVARPPNSVVDVLDVADLVYVRMQVRGFMAEVQVIGPRRDRPSARTLQQLCRDRRVTMLP